ncbi:unnamed protein product [Nesidiocoris tenuis]|uniref:Uncharacterized protein n=1 Tax=Nesidiocoris tenuis TaxID=355587 RepID=A0A6H5GTI7_9HEMI|nr:unnamed protein product [Nesidiocoris tenuis]
MMPTTMEIPIRDLPKTTPYYRNIKNIHVFCKNQHWVPGGLWYLEITGDCENSTQAQGDELRLLSKQRLLALWNMLISITTIPRTSTSDRYGSTSTYQEVILIMSTAPITCYFNYNGRRCPNDT